MPWVASVAENIVAGLRSAFTYAGALDLAAFTERARVGVQTRAGYAEGMPILRGW